VDANLPRAKLLVVGSGDLPPMWMARAKALGLEQRVEFTGFVRDVGSQLARMDVLLHMPRGDSFGTLDLSLQEAITLLNKYIDKVQISGNGYVFTQSPEPGTLIDQTSDLKIELRDLQEL
jgi:glycosyltransferase involved in cell wall biosynthesis